MSSRTTAATPPNLVDVRGPRFAAWVTTAVLVITLLVAAVSPLAAAVILGLQAVVFAIGARGRPTPAPVWADIRPCGGAAAGTGQRARAGTAAEVRPTCRPDLCRRRRSRIRRRRVLGRGHRRCGRAGGRLPQRGVSGSAWAASSTRSSPASGARLIPLNPDRQKKSKGSTPWHARTSWSPPTGLRAI